MAKILVIDDNPDNLISVAATLKHLIPGWTVITVLSGPDGIEKAKREAPDTILLDQLVREKTIELVDKNHQLLEEIEERKRAERALLENLAGFKAIVNATTDVVTLIKPDGTVLELNEALAKQLDVDMETLRGKVMFDFLPAESAALSRRIIAQVLLERKLFQYEVSRKGKCFSIRLFPVLDERGTVTLLVGFSRDVTEYKEMEQKLQHARRMEAIGVLAGGIAHDFNNILFPIMGLSEMMLEDITPESPHHENLEAIHRAAVRAVALVKQILSFSRQAKHEKLPVRIQQVLKEVLKLTRATIPSNIEITQSIQTDCALVMADPKQLHQIAMDLITNAYHAVEASGGSISIELKESVLTVSDRAGTSLEPGKYAALTVADTGCGIDPAVMGKIFEPYFTTKAVGKGTGIGLSVVHGIVKDHGGDIRVFSEPGKGSAFTAYLPLLRKAVEAVSPEEKAIVYETGVEKIFLIDDEEL